jgi:mono/diheme cytochrome c family protein
MRSGTTPTWTCVGAGGLLLALVVNAHGADGDPKAGKTIYEKRCVPCHGNTGKGIGTLPNLSDGRYMATRTDAQLFDKITHGGRGSGMPAWEKILSEPERWDVLAYIRTLSQ